MEITIKINGEEMSLSEARELYGELHKLFGQPPIPDPGKFTWDPYPDPKKMFGPPYVMECGSSSGVKIEEVYASRN